MQLNQLLQLLCLLQRFKLSRQPIIGSERKNSIGKAETAFHWIFNFSVIRQGPVEPSVLRVEAMVHQKLIGVIG
ncbi:hypothetical protein SDC9_132147 [bioreactor metagenome]|uniref:Uncharacterized protein n=1 Tax=bioreactor metagenome TaxID=1076179 RepID=A0A645D6C4_9ZZZZ